MKVVTCWLNNDLLKRLDDLWESLGYPSRHQFLKDLIGECIIFGDHYDSKKFKTFEKQMKTKGKTSFFEFMSKFKKAEDEVIDDTLKIGSTEIKVI